MKDALAWRKMHPNTILNCRNGISYLMVYSKSLAFLNSEDDRASALGQLKAITP